MFIPSRVRLFLPFDVIFFSDLDLFIGGWSSMTINFHICKFNNKEVETVLR